ncbi:hypothetical protein LO772_33235 [Yinghuangia sp. ASG 101]|uniref:hypothetical protein n=1 Tax=Yinghuangia sp. ASG 101 TaxID=2896848 RepID=UPI001E4041EB|nr:hypothetical protein [Yinghuangia sp. ASG 101]UGQ11585.1 hypothetical protein LO772_33235 [Yinghuangia sp. ASG 101]
MVLRDVDEVVGEHTGLSAKVLEYSLIMKSTVDAAKQPGFSAESWAPLAELIAVDAFERVGNFKEVMNWTEYVGFLTGWAPSAAWECSFKRITEAPGLVFLELEERSTVGGHTSVVNSVSVYEFDDTDRIRHIDIYLQMPLPEGVMLQSYDGIRISE